MKRLMTGYAGVLLVAVSGGPAHAVPGNNPFVEDARCDAIVPAPTMNHELGINPPFPLGETISVTVSNPGIFGSCASHPNGVPPDYQVSITNLSGKSWFDVFFVADAGNAVGNADGTILGGDAFRIDNFGINQPLTGGDDGDLIFEPNETWTFNVEDWFAGAGVPLTFGSIGVGVNSGAGSSASIVANQVPAPAMPLLFGLAALGLLVRNRTRR